jgi:hypothetical protein
MWKKTKVMRISRKPFPVKIRQKITEEYGLF